MHNIAAIASGIARSGADIIAIDGFRGGTGAAPTRIRDNVGIPVELALAAVDERLREEGIRDDVSLVAGGSVRNSADVVKAIALGADAVYIATAALISFGCHVCRNCQSGKCNWGIATQVPELTARLNPEEAAARLVNLMTAWNNEIKEMMGDSEKKQIKKDLAVQKAVDYVVENAKESKPRATKASKAAAEDEAKEE